MEAHMERGKSFQEGNLTQQCAGREALRLCTSVESKQSSHDKRLPSKPTDLIPGKSLEVYIKRTSKLYLQMEGCNLFHCSVIPRVTIFST